MATEENQPLGQLIDHVKESIRLKWVELHEQLTSPEKRKVLRREIKDAVSGLGKTLKQFDPRGTVAKKKGATKKKSPAKKKASAKKQVRAKAVKKSKSR